MRIPWIKNTSGKKDAMLTFAVMAFVTVLFKVIAGGLAVSFGEKVFTVGTIDASTIGALLTPTFVAYVARRHTDRRHPHTEPLPTEENETLPPEAR